MNKAEHQIVTITKAWPAIVGPDLATKSRPIGIYNRALIIETASTPTMQVLAFLGKRISEEIPKYVTGTDITRLRIRRKRTRSRV